MASSPRFAFVPPVALLLLALVGAPRPARACSICRCGDPAFNALGKDGYHGLGLRMALDWERFDKDEGDPAVESPTRRRRLM